MHYGPRSYLPDNPTAGALVRLRLRNPTLAGVRGDFWAVADDSGHFEVQGLETTKILYTKKFRVEAYGMDAVTGAITDAPDWGVNGERRLPQRALKVLVDDDVEAVQVVTTEVAGLTVFEMFDPRNLLTPERVEMIDAVLESEPTSFGAVFPLTPPEVSLFGYANRIGSHVETSGVLFVKPGMSLKAVMSTGLYGLGRRLILLNGSEEHPEGIGYSVPSESRLNETVYHVAKDITYLNGSRIANLEKHGVFNRRLTGFHREAKLFLKAAIGAREAHHHQDFLDHSRKAWALAAAAYHDVSSTQSGVIQGPLFLLAMLVPFSHFAERLVCGFPDLRGQVFGFFGFFLAGFFALRYLHPAFELSISPAVILLGFIILTLGLLVTGIGVSRLNHELKNLASGRRGRERNDLQRSGTLLTSIAVGLAHLRRRPLRTALTCTTLILLTFSVLSFTSIRSSLRTNRIDVGAGARYDGVLIRMPGWQTMEMTAYRSFSDRFGGQHIAPRAWISGDGVGSRYLVQRVEDDRRFTEITGITGLSALESSLVHIDEGLEAGRWLRDGEDDACVLPVAVADSLGISAAGLNSASIRVFGEVFRVVGLVKTESMDLPDLNGEPLTPLHPEAKSLAVIEAKQSRGSGSGQLPSFDHLEPNQVIILPFDAVMQWEKAVLISVGLLTDDVEGALKELSETIDINLYAGQNGQRYLINTIGVASVSGLGNLIVPIGIAALIVLNTMMGAVYERTREIGTFNAVGLAPKHVSNLFLAEASAYAVVGAVLGYVLGQTVAQTIGAWGFLEGLELNYSSLSAVLSLGLVMAVVMLSALYPAYQAGKICTPGIERRWRPPRPSSDVLQMTLPFTLMRMDAHGMGAFLAEFWASGQEQSIGAGFYVESLQVRQDGNQVLVHAKTWLAPFDQGVMQNVTLVMKPGEDRYYGIEVSLERTAGDFDTWSRVMRTFLDDLRKQFLVWRTLAQEDRQSYAVELERWVEETSVNGVSEEK
jgi:ABC-type antimicrobial peptide transport system permease subunit